MHTRTRDYSQDVPTQDATSVIESWTSSEVSPSSLSVEKSSGIGSPGGSRDSAIEQESKPALVSETNTSPLSADEAGDILAIDDDGGIGPVPSLESSASSLSGTRDSSLGIMNESNNYSDTHLSIVDDDIDEVPALHEIISSPGLSVFHAGVDDNPRDGDNESGDDDNPAREASETTNQYLSRHALMDKGKNTAGPSQSRNVDTQQETLTDGFQSQNPDDDPRLFQIEYDRLLAVKLAEQLEALEAEARREQEKARQNRERRREIFLKQRQLLENLPGRSDFDNRGYLRPVSGSVRSRQAGSVLSERPDRHSAEQHIIKKKKKKHTDLPSDQIPSGHLENIINGAQGNIGPDDPNDPDYSDSDHESDDNTGDFISDFFDSDPDDSDPDSSDEDSDSDDTSKKTKKKRKSDKLKPTRPFTYNGEENYEKFQKWVYECSVFMKDAQVSKKRQVSQLSPSLGGRAADFFTHEVIQNPRKKWVLSKFIKALFNHCFSSNFRTETRSKFMECKQKGHPIKEYARELLVLSKTVGKIDKGTFSTTFWRGADDWLRAKWADRGLNPEKVSFKDLLKYGERFEKGRQYAKGETGRIRSNPKREETPKESKKDFNSNNSKKRKYTYKNSPPSEEHPRSKPKHQNTEKGKAPSQNQSTRDKQGQRLSPQELDRRRSENLCFNCGKSGHMSRDCPDKNSTRPPMKSSSVSIITASADVVNSKKQSGKKAISTMSALLFSPEDGEPSLLTPSVGLMVAPSISPSPSSRGESPPPFSYRGIDLSILPIRTFAFRCEPNMDIQTVLWFFIGHWVMRMLNDHLWRLPGDNRYPDKLPTGYRCADRWLCEPEDDCLVIKDTILGNSYSVPWTRLISSDGWNPQEFVFDLTIMSLFGPGKGGISATANEWMDHIKGDIRLFGYTSCNIEESIIAGCGTPALNLDRCVPTDMHHLILDGGQIDEAFSGSMDEDGNFYPMTFRPRTPDEDESEDEPITISESSKINVNHPEDGEISDHFSETYDLDTRRIRRIIRQSHVDLSPPSNPIPFEYSVPHVTEVTTSEYIENSDERPSELSDGSSSLGDISNLSSASFERTSEVSVVGKPYESSDDEDGYVSEENHADDEDGNQSVYRYDSPFLKLKKHSQRLHSNSVFIDENNEPILYDVDSGDVSSLEDRPSNPFDDPDVSIEPVSSPQSPEPDEKTRLTLDQESINRYNSTTFLRSCSTKLERTSARPRDHSRSIPKPIIIEVLINNQKANALLDSGLLADFMSTTLADQLGLQRTPLDKPIHVQLATKGSRTTINYGVMSQIEWGSISESRRFDVMNLDGYDIILGTPFIFQHCLTLGLNPSHVTIGSPESMPIEGDENIIQIASKATQFVTGMNIHKSLKRFVT